ncbi:hypothetical protein [Piscibacillus salipiscarius]|uniref:hypothetical protein n=1 Tax=Piscibacillus salipiscarius TaxID=299480 RepID=UPI0024364753|nr:hypothetical protein [Piscibacillus salipiscarius]
MVDHRKSFIIQLMNNKIESSDVMFSIIQWFIFLLANAVAIPIVIGSIFQMDTMAIMLLMQRTFLSLA